MQYEVQVKEVPPLQVAAVRKTIPMDAIGQFVPEAFGQIAASLGRAGAAPTGMPFVVYHTMDPATPEWDVEVCFPVAAPFAGDGEAYGAEIGGGTMAATVHRGPYDQIGPAYQAIAAWVAHQGRQFAGPPRELYLNDPTEVGMASAETEIDWQIA